jgi:NCS1 family nucleobase:cation symporter-1
VLSVITVAQTFRPRWRADRAARVLLSIVFGGLSFTMALLGATHFMANYGHFLTLLLCVMAPWTAVNLVDFYWVKHGAYEVSSFFAADGGIYGRFNSAALSCYALGIAVQGPFLATDFYVGPAARALGGIDISWVVALIVSGGAYLLWAKGSASETPGFEGSHQGILKKG